MHLERCLAHSKHYMGICCYIDIITVSAHLIGCVRMNEGGIKRVERLPGM